MQPLPDTRLSLRHYGASPGSHAHEHFQVLWGWQGVLELDIEGRGARMTAGRVAVIPPGARHDFWAGRRPRGPHAQCFVLDSSDPRLERLAGRVLDTPAGLPGLLGFLQALQADDAWLQAATPLLLQSLWAGGSAPAGAARGRRIDWPQLQHWVDSHLSLPLDVAALAAQVHLSPSQFAARCVAQHGLPPLAWVRERRLACARSLRQQGLPVDEVAARCGYRSASALIAALRRAG
ncbi:AraC family transcriptional regulator [Ideonella sp. BN130291]|uniref:AraC family transcriptional regulator n=1 Tax=Ideonella sp. BN130291 TaxID=3112940 RepID=UPI002E25ED48|nr:AraC family transcriptional regulator [Ideonella sp. BN130291]